MRSVLIIVSFLTLTVSNHSWSVACGDDVASDITLTSDLHCTSGYTALNVVADNVSINMNGYKLSGSTSLAGITLNNVNNVSISGGNILDFYAGINASRSNKISISKMTFFETGHGIVFHQINYSSISENDFVKTRSSAIKIYNTESEQTSFDNILVNNEFYKAASGIYLCGNGTNKNEIAGNLIWKSVDYSIHLNNSSNNTIVQNEILESQGTAIRINHSSNNLIESNYLKDGSTGVSILANDNVVICDSTDSGVSKKNEFVNNSIFNFETGINFGLGLSRSPTIYYNTLSKDKIYFNAVGIRFQSEAWVNDASNAVFQGNISNVIDEGTSNNY